MRSSNPFIAMTFAVIAIAAIVSDVIVKQEQRTSPTQLSSAGTQLNG